MNHLKKIFRNILDIFDILSNNADLKDQLSYASFLVSLLPIPGIQQAGMVISKITSDNLLKQQFNEILDEIKKVNTEIGTLKHGLDQIKEISGIIKYNSEINKKFSSFVDKAKEKISVEESSWTMLTNNESYQEIINSFVEADNIEFISNNQSINFIENTEVKSNKTLFKADNKSTNYIKKSSFNDKAGRGAVSMDGINTFGNVEVEGSGISIIGGGSGITIGGNPNQLSGICPICNQKLFVDKINVQNGMKVRCWNCTSVLDLKIE
jgi:DNA gyrase/topoisomerase IV subunit A